MIPDEGAGGNGLAMPAAGSIEYPCNQGEGLTLAVVIDSKLGASNF